MQLLNPLFNKFSPEGKRKIHHNEGFEIHFGYKDVISEELFTIHCHNQNITSATKILWQKQNSGNSGNSRILNYQLLYS
jgi:hypothetical protein